MIISSVLHQHLGCALPGTGLQGHPLPLPPAAQLPICHDVFLLWNAWCWCSTACNVCLDRGFILEVTQDLECGYLPAHPFPPPPAEAARELFSPFLMHPLCLRTGGTTPAQLPALPVGWAELQFGIQFGIAARLILSTEVFA